MSQTITPILPLAVPPPPPNRISVEHYHRMIEEGAFADDERFELLDGSVVPKMPKNPPHRVSTRLTLTELEKMAPPGWYVDSQEPMTTSDSEPEPDVYVARGTVRDYTKRHPGPGDTKLIVEVSDTTLARDRGIKKGVYARAKVPVYWIVNLVDRCVEVYTNPSGPTESPDYDPPQIFGANDRVPVVLDGQEIGQIEVKSILP